jgi:membrane associated rhomboid family serine protease
MARDTENDDYAPLGHIGAWPVHVTTLLVLACVVFVVTGVLMQAFLSTNLVVTSLGFTLRQAAWEGQVWRVLTHPLAGALNFGFVFNMLVLFVAGRETERFLGRRVFTRLALLLVLAAPVAASLVALAVPETPLAGSGPLVLGICVAFTTLYPNTGVVFGIANKWVIGVLIAVYALMALAAHDFTGLAVLVVCTMLAHLFIRHARGEFEREAPPVPPRPARRPRVKTSASPQAPPDDVEAVDRVLEKISRDGMASLSAEERDVLERASRKLAKRP